MQIAYKHSNTFRDHQLGVSSIRRRKIIHRFNQLRLKL